MGWTVKTNGDSYNEKGESWTWGRRILMVCGNEKPSSQKFDVDIWRWKVWMIIEPHFSSFLHSKASTELETNCCTQMSNPYDISGYIKERWNFQSTEFRTAHRGDKMIGSPWSHSTANWRNKTPSTPCCVMPISASFLAEVHSPDRHRLSFIHIAINRWISIEDGMSLCAVIARWIEVSWRLEVIDISKKICRVLDWRWTMHSFIALMSVRRQCKAFMLTIKQKPKLDLKFMLHVQVYVTMLNYYMHVLTLPAMRTLTASVEHESRLSN